MKCALLLGDSGVPRYTLRSIFLVCRIPDARLEITHIWAPTYSFALEAATVPEGKVKIFAEDAPPASDSDGRRDLNAILESEVEILFVCLDPCDQASILNRIFSYTPPPDVSYKHVMSLMVPTFNCEHLQDLLSLRKVQQQEHQKRCQKKYFPLSISPMANLVWSICEPFRYETVLTKVLKLFPDIGKLVSVSFSASMVPRCLNGDSFDLEAAKRLETLLINKFKKKIPVDSKQGPTVADQMNLIGMISVLRKLFGSVSAVIGSHTYGASEELQSVVSNFTFTSGLTSNFLYAKSSIDFFVLIIQGTVGSIKLTWNPTTSLFETQRDLNCFEHPTILPPTGLEWSVSSFLDAVSVSISLQHQKPEEIQIQDLSMLNHINTLFDSWTDIAVMDGLLQSMSRPISFAPKEV